MNELKHKLEMLADGELSSSDIDGVLAACDVSEHHWRDLALLFVERQQLRSVLSDSSTMPPLFEKSLISISADKQDSRSNSTLSWVSIAALLLVTLSVGFGLGNMNQSANTVALEGSPSQPGSFAASNEESAATESDLKPELAVSTNQNSETSNHMERHGSANQKTDDHQLAATDAASGQPSVGSQVQHSGAATSESTPVVFVGNRPFSGASNAARHEWLKRGYVVKERPAWKTYQRDGQRIAVPDPQFKLQYVGGLAYQ